jgi:hypothetical protein
MASSREDAAWRRSVRARSPERGVTGRSRRRTWTPWATGLLVLGWTALSAAVGSAQARSQSLAERDLRRTVVSLVTALRVAEGCQIRLTEAARRRAAELEAALLALSPAEGARLRHAASMREAREGASRAGRAWCSAQRADIEEAEELLASPESEDLLRRLRALHRDEDSRG